MPDAAYAIVTKPTGSFTGHFLSDDTCLYAEGERDFDQYRVDPSVPLSPDSFVLDDVPALPFAFSLLPCRAASFSSLSDRRAQR